MQDKQKLFEFGEKVWLHRKKFGFTKKLTTDLQLEAVKFCDDGISANEVSKVIGVSKNTMVDWVKRHSQKNAFNEVSVAATPSPTNYQIKLFAQIPGCHVELIGVDYALLQRTLRKLAP